MLHLIYSKPNAKIVKRKSIKMKKIITVLLVVLITNQSFSQEMKTLFKKDTTSKAVTYGGYGAPIIGMGILDNKPGFLIGGKGGLIRNHHFGFGGIGVAIMGNTSISDTTTVLVGISDSIHTYNMSLGYGGVYLEYVFNYDSPIHFAIMSNFAAGGLLAGGDRSSSKIKSSALFIIEPGVNLEFNFSKHFVPALNIGYRFVVSNTANSTKTGAAASGLNVSLIFKLGKF